MKIINQNTDQKTFKREIRSFILGGVADFSIILWDDYTARRDFFAPYSTGCHQKRCIKLDSEKKLPTKKLYTEIALSQRISPKGSNSTLLENIKNSFRQNQHSYLFVDLNTPLTEDIISCFKYLCETTFDDRRLPIIFVGDRSILKVINKSPYKNCFSRILQVV